MRGNLFPHTKNCIEQHKGCATDILRLAHPDPNHPLRLAHQRDFPFVCRDQVASDYAEYFRFAIVRNPFSRILSCYRNKILRNQDPVAQAQGIAKSFQQYGKFRMGMSFDEFLVVISSIPDEDADRHFRSQHTYLCGPNDQLLPNCLAKFEHLDEELDYIFGKLGAGRPSLPHLVRSGTGNDYRKFFSEEGKRLVFQRYTRDFELLDYDF